MGKLRTRRNGLKAGDAVQRVAAYNTTVHCVALITRNVAALSHTEHRLAALGKIKHAGGGRSALVTWGSTGFKRDPAIGKTVPL